MKIKNLLFDNVILVYYEVGVEIEVIVDVSLVGFGVMLIQKKRDGYRFVMYISRLFSFVEQRYSQME